jgi:hypothetical protein
VQAAILHYLKKAATYLLAPLYYHFGQYELFLEIMGALQEVVETLGMYYMNFFFYRCFDFFQKFYFSNSQ